MIRPICRELSKDRKGWKRYFITTESGNTDDVNFEEPIADSRNRLEPVDTELYILEHLKFSFPQRTRLTFKDVVGFIPAELVKDVAAVEWIHSFHDLLDASFFVNEYRRGNVVMIVALLTEKDTGKGLPGIKLAKEHKPIGVNDDEWAILSREIT